MKMKILFTIIMVVLLSSCTKEDVSDKETKGEPSSLTLRIKGGDHASTGRATGSTPDPDSEIKDFIIFVFKQNGDEDIDPTQYDYTVYGSVVRGLGITSDAREVYVIANTGISTTLSTSLLAANSKTALQAIVGDALEGNVPTQAAGNMWMSGNKSFTPISGETSNVAVTLQFVAAKIQLTQVTLELPADTKLHMEELTIYNAGAVSCLVAHDDGGTPSLIPADYFSHSASTPFYLGGALMDSGDCKPDFSNVDPMYKFALTTDESGDIIIDEASGKNQHSFYVFENDGIKFEAKPTVLTLKGKWEYPAGTFTDVYYSYFFKEGNMFDGETINRGMKYEMKFKIKKEGGSNPIVPTPNTSVEIAITPATWTPKIIEKVFQ